MARWHSAPADRSIDDKARALLAPYLDVVAGAQRAQASSPRYPGSPALIRALLRPQDRLIACELEPTAAAALAHNLGRERRVRTVAIDGWMALNAYVPPPERRGLVLIDPPFERDDEFAAARAGARSGASQMAKRHLSPLVSDQGPAGAGCAGTPTAPLRDPEDPARRSRVRSAKRARAPRGCGLIAINPPWTLEAELVAMLPALARIFAGSCRVDWLTRPD